MDNKQKIFKHLQDKIASVGESENKEDLDELAKQVALTRVFLMAEEKYEQTRVRPDKVKPK